MGRFVKGDVVVVRFPFSNLSSSKRRPALVISDLDGDDIILCQITSQSRTDRYAVRLEIQDFENGSLKAESMIRPNKIFTADKNIVLYSACRVKNEILEKTIISLIDILKSQ